MEPGQGEGKIMKDHKEHNAIHRYQKSSHSYKNVEYIVVFENFGQSSIFFSTDSKILDSQKTLTCSVQFVGQVTLFLHCQSRYVRPTNYRFML